MDKISSLGMPMSPQEIFKRYKRQILGMPKASPSSLTKYQVIFQCAIFLLLHILCVILGASQFSFSVFFGFVCYNKWVDPSILLWERDTLRFNCKKHSSFHSYCSASVLFFQYCVQLLFFTHILFRACLFSLPRYDLAL